GGTTPPPPAFLGISGEEAENGVRLTQVLPNTPAASGGLKPGDIVIAAGMTKIEEFFDLTEVLRGKRGGDQLMFKVRREKATLDITVTLASPRIGPQGPGAERFALASLLGAQVRDVQGGVRVGPLFQRGPAVQAGLQDGDVIKNVDKKPVGNALQLLALLQNKKPGDKLSFTVVRNKQDKDIA